MTNFPITLVTSEHDLEACYTLRKEVFVEEQSVPLELELDEYDAAATHFLMRQLDGTPVATARLLNKRGLAKIGRVAVVRSLRGQGLGLELMRTVLQEACRQGFREAVLDSQTYAIPFYERLGFVAEGEEFDDAGIPHFLMRRIL